MPARLRITLGNPVCAVFNGRSMLPGLNINAKENVMKIEALGQACLALAMSDGLVEFSQSGFVDFSALILSDRFLNETRASILEAISPKQEDADFSKYLNELDKLGLYHFCNNHAASGLLSQLVGSSMFLRHANRQVLEEKTTSEAVKLEDEIEWLEKVTEDFSLAACDLSPRGKDQLSKYRDRSLKYAERKGYWGSIFSEDDVAQGTTMKVFQEYPRLSWPSERFEDYMDRVSPFCEEKTRQVYIDNLRKDLLRRCPSLYDADGQVIFEPIDSESDPFDNVVFEEFVLILHGILNPKENDPKPVLTEEEPDAIIGKYIYGKTQQQIATELGVSQSTVNRAITSGLKKLLGVFGEWFEND